MIRVLIAEDDLSIMLTLSAAFRHHGFLVAEASQVADALAMLPAVDAVICDDLDGCCWPILLRAKELGKRVLLYTADDWLAEMAREEEIAALVKPGSLEKVLAMVGEGAGVQA